MRKSLKKGLFWAFAISAVITAFTWFMLAKTSPLNHSISPDVHKNPIISPFVIINIPAGIVFLNVFGKLGAEWGYMVCVFFQWLSISTAIAMVTAAAKKQSPN